MSNQPNKPIKIGIMSFAHGHAHSYASTLPTMPNVTLAGIYDDHAERGAAAAQRALPHRPWRAR